MYRQEPVVGQCEDDHLDEVASRVRSDRQLFQSVAIGIGIEVDHHERVIGGMTDLMVGDSVSSSRSMDLHTPLV